MEANTVILALSEYNSLRDFKANLEKGNAYRVLDYSTTIYSIGCNNPAVVYVSTDDAVKEMAAKNETLFNEIARIYKENYELKNPKKPEISLKDIKKMSVWEFIKWRRK